MPSGRKKVEVVEIIVDAVWDSIRMFPFLLGAFCIIEFLEKYSTEQRDHMLMRFQKAGPVIGSAFGCIPQCGFSVVAANLYSGGIISLGTLLAVFMSTSDEAVLIMLGHPDSGNMILRLIFTKVLIAVIAGYIADLLFAHKTEKKKRAGDLCVRSHCGCEGEHGIIRPAFHHSVRLLGYILLFTICINLGIEGIGRKTLETAVLGGSFFQPFLTALIGLIPNCASSVLLTELYMQGILSFASTVSGLCASAGIGLAVLFKVNRPLKETWKIVGILYSAAVLSGMLLNLGRG